MVTIKSQKIKNIKLASIPVIKLITTHFLVANLTPASLLQANSSEITRVEAILIPYVARVIPNKYTAKYALPPKKLAAP